MRLLLFILISLNFSSCVQGQVKSDFYKGLKDSANAVKHFEKALDSSNEYIRRAAAEQLAVLNYEGKKLSAKTVEKARKEAGGYWAAAFDAVGKVPDKEKALALLLGAEHGELSVEARSFTLREFEKRGENFSDTELAAIEGRFAVSRSQYNEALVFFRAFQKDEKWTAQIPELFIKYPNLINDLGRAFQYSASGREGFDLFLQWEAALTDEMAANAPELSAQRDSMRFSLLFFAARIARRNRLDQVISLFERALPLAPETGQADACIWYILDSSLSAATAVFLQRLEQFIPSWHNDGYFDDILEKFLQALTSKKDWKNLIHTFELIQDRDTKAAKAGYAWIIARAIEEGYLSAEEKQMAARAVDLTEASADVFKRIAYNSSGEIPALYYRSLSADALGEPFLELPSAAPAVRKSARAAVRTTGKAKTSPALQFLLGFFNNDAADFALRYIRQFENELAPDELRAVAQALAHAGMYAQSMRETSFYINRDGYTPGRIDMELMFPRPYMELVEKNAAEIGISPAILYGLIRTESAFQSDIVSRSGAVGLTQLMPETAREMANRLRRAGGSDYTAGENGLDLNDPSVNIHLGSYYLSYLLGRFDDTLLSLLAYNGGMNRVRRWRTANALPADLFLETITIPETRDYGRKVMGAAAVYEALYYSSL
ncbi:MAG: lytic transglycosylase domain-containing protein [Treponema sp.]|nr:lytic transglycosylase domain-containing protein [Treponema sp.]